MSDNLWPDFEVSGQARSPKAVVQEAGIGLREKTDGRIDFVQHGTTQISDQKVSVSYALWVPALNYSYPFIRIVFGVVESYPVRVAADGLGEFQANNEPELIGVLAKVFSADRTVKTITRLMQLASE